MVQRFYSMKLIDKILKEAVEVPINKIKYFYHATTETNFYSILETGLKVDTFSEIYLADSPDAAARFLVLRIKPPIYVVKINASKLDKSELSESFDHSQTFFKARAYVYGKDIPSSAIMASGTLVFGKER